ncbi:hypothetical protein TMPK1_37960 [Rhodospirillales bacterium TMPK1]|uniref:Uncharacterized protein n=1 Tax=Roseiterribacter gracilis TaxID=2812848 RepID=A0A8S8XI04_9PROT|nr:hypothetical protein TMPK1_37960 [Rhodospirillales bacterium TMPK1]
MIADPRTDIGDLYAWTSADGKQLNLVMTIVGRAFSDRVDYVFHVDSGRAFGKTSATTEIVCRFPAAGVTSCKVGDDEVRGDADRSDGLRGRSFRVFAGVRDDPFFNNVRGTRDAYNVADAALKAGAKLDRAACPAFSKATSREILDKWHHTNGHAAVNFLEGWKVAAIVVAIDLDVVTKGGKTLGVWAATVGATRQIDRAGRPLTGNALLGTVAADEISDAMKEDFNAATPADAAKFVPEIEKGLALYDGFDGVCGNQLLAAGSKSRNRYRAMAQLLADDRLWVNAASSRCTQLFAVELAARAGQQKFARDCGGRTPNYDAVNVYRSLLVMGRLVGVDDGVHRDDRDHSDTVFPFLAAPAAANAASQP